MKTTRKYPAIGCPFMGDMVRAVIADRKTQTRRLIRFQGYPKDDQPDPNTIRSAKHQNGNVWLFTDQENGEGNYAYAKSKYQVGDILYVKETWRTYFPVDEYDRIDRDNPVIEYAADGLEPIYLMDDDGGIATDKNGAERFIPLRPSQFMPYSVARLFLKVIDVRPERLNNASVSDCIAEGIELNYPYYRDYLNPKSSGWLETITTQWPDEKRLYHAEQASYRTLWDSINGYGSWRTNPWVWVYTFERTEKPATE